MKENDFTLFFETSAKDGKNVEIVKEIYKKK